jgi:hypothetical protein
MAYQKTITALCSGIFDNKKYFPGDDISWLAQSVNGPTEENIIANGLGRVEYVQSDSGDHMQVVFASVGGFSDGKLFEAGDNISFLTVATEGRDAIPASRLVETGLGRIGYLEMPLSPKKVKDK